MTEKEFVKEYSGTLVGLTALADLAKDTTPHNGLALRAINYMNTLIELENYLDKLGYQWEV